MSKLLVVVALCFVCAVLAADPTKPQPSAVFHAAVNVQIQEGRYAYSGGGLYAFDTPKGHARSDFKLEDSEHKQKFIHELARYDLHSIYVIEEDKCNKNTVTGDLESPWAWLDKATFAGTASFQGKTLDEWQVVEGNTTTKLSVLSENVNVPVYLHTRGNENGVIRVTSFLFLEFDTKEPQDWVFYVPAVCNKTARLDRLGGDANAVVYFANANWNCADVHCNSRVPDGAAQPGYACAEFTARALAAGGYIPGLGAYDAQGSYWNWKGHNLCYTSGLNDALSSIGFHKLGNSAGNVNAAVAVIGDGGDGYFSHACIGVSNAHVDCHNIARANHLATGSFFKGIDAVWSP